MKIDIHRHVVDKGTTGKVIRNLFHDQTKEIVPGGYYSVGLHPWHVADETIDLAIESVSKIADNAHVIAIGEAGLDKAIRAPLVIQKQAFEAQIHISTQANKPMIIHCVRAYQELLEYRIQYRPPKSWIIHWFNAGQQVGEQLIREGFYLSFGHMLFNEKSKVFKAFRSFPPDKIFFETDDTGYTIDEIYERASELLSIHMPDLETQIELNFYNCFGFRP
jgi:TatD DNase family protein